MLSSIVNIISGVPIADPSGKSGIGYSSSGSPCSAPSEIQSENNWISSLVRVFSPTKVLYSRFGGQGGIIGFPCL